MDAFWKVYCRLDESGRKEIIKKYLNRHISNNLDTQIEPHKFSSPPLVTNLQTDPKKSFCK
jgi:hypothetical protein